MKKREVTDAICFIIIVVVVVDDDKHDDFEGSEGDGWHKSSKEKERERERVTVLHQHHKLFSSTFKDV